MSPAALCLGESLNALAYLAVVTTNCPHLRCANPMAARRRHGEDGIYFEQRGACRDPQRHRTCPGLWCGEVTVGYTEDGKRQRRKVSGTAKAAVLDRLTDLHKELDKGIVRKRVSPTTRYATPPGTGSMAERPRISRRTRTSSSRS